MKFDFAMSARISEDTVKEMIKQSVEQQTGRTVSKVTFHTRTESDYMDRYSSTVFDGCTVEFDMRDRVYDPMDR